MSDFLAIAAVKGKVLHLVDWDRPVWFLADNPLGDRIIPDPNSFLTDALLFFSYQDFNLSIDLFEGQRGENRVYQMSDSTHFDQLYNSRNLIRNTPGPIVLLAHFGPCDSNLVSDLKQFNTPIHISQINNPSEA
jgi:hypothetical protein